MLLGADIDDLPPNAPVVKSVDALACQSAFVTECSVEARVRKNVRVRAPPGALHRDIDFQIMFHA